MRLNERNEMNDHSLFLLLSDEMEKYPKGNGGLRISGIFRGFVYCLRFQMYFSDFVDCSRISKGFFDFHGTCQIFF